MSGAFVEHERSNAITAPGHNLALVSVEFGWDWDCECGAAGTGPTASGCWDRWYEHVAGYGEPEWWDTL